jgi:hypothetical protein
VRLRDGRGHFGRGLPREAAAAGGRSAPSGRRQEPRALGRSWLAQALGGAHLVGRRVGWAVGAVGISDAGGEECDSRPGEEMAGSRLQ